MARTARVESSSGIYHIVLKGVNHENIFATNAKKAYFLKILQDKAEENNIECYCYCIMTTHVHLLLRGEKNKLSYCLKAVQSIYAIDYNKSGKRNGHLFQNRFYSSAIETENSFWNCVNYIHNNPVKAEMAKNVADYRYSSYNEFVSQKARKITEKSIQMMKNRFQTIENFQKFSRDNRVNEWFYGDENEIKQQKNELIELHLSKYRDETETYRSENQIRKLEWVSELAKELNIYVWEIRKYLMEHYMM